MRERTAVTIMKGKVTFFAVHVLVPEGKGRNPAASSNTQNRVEASKRLGASQPGRKVKKKESATTHDCYCGAAVKTFIFSGLEAPATMESFQERPGSSSPAQPVQNGPGWVVVSL